MDNPKPSAKEFHEGPEAARRFGVLVKKVVTVLHSEIQKRHKVWERARKSHRAKAR